MASLRPEDLNISALPRTRLGHLKEEAVAEFLQRAAWDYRSVVAENKRLAKTVEELTHRVEELSTQLAPLQEAATQRKDSDELARTLLASAQRTAREERESARRDCELMLKKAAQRVERMEADVTRRAEARLTQLARLEALREEVIARLRSTLEAVTERHGHAADDAADDTVVPIRPKR
jgi:cell division septum initiation protein DivIVA